MIDVADVMTGAFLAALVERDFDASQDEKGFVPDVDEFGTEDRFPALRTKLVRNGKISEPRSGKILSAGAVSFVGSGTTVGDRTTNLDEPGPVFDVDVMRLEDKREPIYHILQVIHIADFHRVERRVRLGGIGRATESLGSSELLLISGMVTRRHTRVGSRDGHCSLGETSDAAAGYGTGDRRGSARPDRLSFHNVPSRVGTAGLWDWGRGPERRA
jgi:hypothetical protein